MNESNDRDKARAYAARADEAPGGAGAVGGVINPRNDQRPEAYDDGSETEINLYEIWRTFLRFWWLCPLIAAVLALATLSVCILTFEPEYTSEATFTVLTEKVGTGVSKYAYTYVRATAEQLSNTFPGILQSNLLQDDICRDLGIEEMTVTLSASSVKETNWFTLKATGNDPQLTLDVLNSAIRNYPGIAKYVVGNTELDMIVSPELPTEPDNANDCLKFAAIGGLVGVIIALAYIVLYTTYRRTVRSGGDVREKLNMHCLGCIPEVVFKKSRRRGSSTLLITNSMTGSGFQESIRALRNGIIRASDGKHKVIMITSTVSGEGKTTVVVNLAAALAKSEKKVLVVDADIGSADVCNLIGSLPEHTEGSRYDIILNEKLDISVLSFNPESGLQAKEVRAEDISAVIGGVRDSYDYIIIDTPPCGISADPIVIGAAADAAIFVIRNDTVSVARIINTLDGLLSTDVELLGCVVNGTENGGASYGRYGHGRYGYGRYGYGRYGYGYGYGSRENAGSTGVGGAHSGSGTHSGSGKSSGTGSGV